LTTAERLSRPAFRDLFREKPLWFLQILTIGFFARPLFFRETFFFRDLYLWFFPQRRRLVELARDGLPLWDPYIHGGQPFLGEINNVALYPSSLLGFALPPIIAFNVEIVLHFLLCGLAVYLLARIVGLSPLGSFIAGTVFTFCGFTLSLGNFLNRILATPHFPLLLLFWHLFLLERRQRWFVAAVTSGALQLLAGSAELLILSLVVALAWGLLFPYPRPIAPWKTFLQASFLSIAIAGIAAVQLLPTIELIRRSSRGHELPYESFTTWSLSPRRLPEVIVPGFFGRTDTLAERDYWGNRVEDRGFPYILSIYFGVLATGLALFGAIGPENSIFPTRMRLLLAGLLVLSLLLGLGRNLPLFKLLYSVVPGARVFRYPVKFLACAALGVALLAGSASQSDFAVTERRAAGRRRVAIVFGSLAVSLATVAVLLRFAPAFRASFESVFFRLPIGDAVVAHRLSFRVGFAAAFAAFGAFLYQRKRRNWHLPVIAAAVVLELLPWGYLVNPTAPRSLLTDDPPLAAALRPLLSGGRLFRDPNPPFRSLEAPTNQILWQYRWNRETLNFYSAASADIPVIFHDDFDRLEPLRLERLTEFVVHAPWEQRRPFLGSTGVTLVVTTKPSLPGMELVGSYPNRSNLTFFVFRNRAAAPFASFVSRWQFASSNPESIRRMLRPGFDPTADVVLEGSGREPPTCLAPAPSLTRLETRINFSRLIVDTPCEGYLVFSQPFNPGWRLYSGRKRLPILRANSVSSAAYLPAGRQELRWAYVPIGLYVGAGISLSTVVLLALKVLMTAGGARIYRRGSVHPQP